MSRVFNYDPSRVSLIIAGQEIEGLDKESSITFSKDEDRYSYHAGIKDGVRLRNPNHKGQIKINLLMGSASNSYLDQFVQAGVDENSDEKDYFSVRFVSKNAEDGNIDFEATCRTAWVMKEPETVWSSTNHQVREWTIDCGELLYKFPNPFNQNVGAV